jgi:hypothetical protein
MIDWLISWSWPAFGVVIMANLLVRCQRARAAHRGQPCRVGPPNLGSRVEGLDGQVSEVSPPTALKSLTQVVTVTGQQISHPGTLHDPGRLMIMPRSSASIASKRSTVRARSCTCRCQEDLRPLADQRSDRGPPPSPRMRIHQQPFHRCELH